MPPAPGDDSEASVFPLRHAPAGKGFAEPFKHTAHGGHAAGQNESAGLHKI